jgi:phage/plasmid-associated DNA primase
LNPLKEGINIQVANMHNKRMVVYTEPDSENKKINASTMKELTGGKKISAESKFSNDDETRLKAIHILECNKRPKINGKIDTSITGRICDIPFVSYFTTNKDELNDDNANNVYEANSYYKSDEFKDEYKTTLFYYLIDFIKKYKIKNGNDVIDKLIDCTEVKERTKAYLDYSDEKYDWFINAYKKKDKSYVSMKDIFYYFKQSDYYNNLTKKDKRDLNYNSFTQYIKENHNLRRFFRDTYKYKDENGCKKCVRSILLGFIYNPNDNEGVIDEGSESDYLE